MSERQPSPAELAVMMKSEGKLSPIAAETFKEAYERGDARLQARGGATDCAEGCVIEWNGHCPHGYRSAARTAYLAGMRGKLREEQG